MGISILKGCCGDGGGRSQNFGRSKSVSGRTGLISTKVGNNVAVSGSIVLLLVWSFVGNCWGKPFHAGGQAEIEEDTTQGSLKEKFSPSGSLVIGSASAGGAHSPTFIDDSILEDIGDGEDSEDDTMMMSNIGLVPLGNRGESFPQRWADYKTYRHMIRPMMGSNNNYGTSVQKRSPGGSGARTSYSFDDGGGEEVFQRLQRLSRDNSRPMYYEQSGSATPSAGIDAPSSSAIRQKLNHLRNQYGDKWFAFAGPYAYRKRQILYRQCFFNPISCF